MLLEARLPDCLAGTEEKHQAAAPHHCWSLGWNSHLPSPSSSTLSWFPSLSATTSAGRGCLLAEVTQTFIPEGCESLVTMSLPDVVAIIAHLQLKVGPKIGLNGSPKFQTNSSHPHNAVAVLSPHDDQSQLLCQVGCMCCPHFCYHGNAIHRPMVPAPGWPRAGWLMSTGHFLLFFWLMSP